MFCNGSHSVTFGHSYNIVFNCLLISKTNFQVFKKVLQILLNFFMSTTSDFQFIAFGCSGIGHGNKVNFKIHNTLDRVRHEILFYGIEVVFCLKGWRVDEVYLDWSFNELNFVFFFSRIVTFYLRFDFFCYV